MKFNQLSKETITNLQKLIGGKILDIYVEGGSIEKSENMIFDGAGMIAVVVKKGNSNYKWRLKFHDETEGYINAEFYEWQHPISIKERYNPKTGEVNYDQDGGEDFKKYHVSFKISPKADEDIELYNQIKSIKIYHYSGDFDNGGNTDYLAFIDIETETGRRIIIEEDDPIHTFYIHFDDLTSFEYRLAEIHDDNGRTFGQNRYKLKYEIN